mmetsp:Transcript_65052/g.151095  ORF Transcript_65052/g.151095 Transcript_65052/m.151095 type:complete len:229 (+) Transcript_65052:703-1389(+)
MCQPVARGSSHRPCAAPDCGDDRRDIALGLVGDARFAGGSAEGAPGTTGHGWPRGEGHSVPSAAPAGAAPTAGNFDNTQAGRVATCCAGPTDDVASSEPSGDKHGQQTHTKCRLGLASLSRRLPSQPGSCTREPCATAATASQHGGSMRFRAIACEQSPASAQPLAGFEPDGGEQPCEDAGSAKRGGCPRTTPGTGGAAACTCAAYDILLAHLAAADALARACRIGSE